MKTAEQILQEIRHRAAKHDPGCAFLPFPELIDRLFSMVEELDEREENLEREIELREESVQNPPSYLALSGMITGRNIK